MSVREEDLLKALAQMEDLAKGGDAASGQGNKTPKTTAEANGGLSNVGDKSELAVKATKAKKTFAQWAKEEATEHESTSKAFGRKEDDDEDEESSEESGSDEESSVDKAMAAEDDESDDSDSDSSECTSKSMRRPSIAELIKSDNATGPLVDAAPYLEKLTDSVSMADYELRKSIVDMQRRNDKFNGALAKSVALIGQSVVELKRQVADMLDTPVSERRSVLSKSEIAERFAEEAADFSKQQVLDAMINLLQRGQLQPHDVVRYETTNSMEPEVRKSVEVELRKSA